ncbi:hypothetical protein BGZ60DRAFT_153681 [Tricladium varicosporioides]|nr:hypothetical protein BGZ60DRAFT_153681 [Hymenoscyphus varicosporioides]
MESSRDGCAVQGATIKRSSTMPVPQKIYYTGFPIAVGNTPISHPNYSRPSVHRSHRQSIMHSSDTDSTFRLRAAKRVSRPASIRTSVSGMKSLIPLQLASPVSSEFSDCPSVKSAKRSTFGLSDPALPTFPTTQDTVRQPLAFIRLPLVVRREKYRDTPIYSEAGSPVPSPAYYQKEFQLDSSSSSDGDWVTGCESPITEHSELSPSRCLSMDAIGCSPLRIESLHMQSPIVQEVPQSSELSFKCLGEQPLDEATWLKNVAAQTSQPTLESLPELLAQKMPLEPAVEGWLSETDNDGEQEDANAYTTALSPITTSFEAISPSQSQFPSLPIKIPPRSSSLCGIRPAIFNYEDRDSWMEVDDENITPKCEHALDGWAAYEPYAATFHSSSSDDEYNDDNLSYSPFSPSTQSSKRSLSHHELRSRTKRLSALSHLVSPPPVQSPCSPVHLSVDNILSLLEESSSDIHSDECLRCPSLIPSMRAHLHPTPPSLSNSTLNKASLKRRVTMGISSLARSSSDLVPLAPNLPNNNLNEPVSNNPLNTPPNLEPLSRIFPYASYNTLSSIYSHILAYIFVQHLKSFKTSASSSPNASRPTSSISGSPVKIPAKAASMLGITTIFTAPDVVDLDEDYFLPERIETVSNQLVRYIAHLSRTMRPTSTMSKDLEPDYDFATELLLRALVEVVTNCEIQSFNL